MPDWNEPIRSRLRPLNLPGARENEIVEELSLHLDDRYAELRRAASADQHARELALEELEGHDLLAQELAKNKSIQAPEPG